LIFCLSFALLHIWKHWIPFAMYLTSLRVCPGLLALVGDLFLCVLVYISHSPLQILCQCYGIDGTTRIWIDAFLDKRIQRVVVDGEASRCSYVTSGVPKGTVLGPTLFLVFINDIADILHSTARVSCTWGCCWVLLQGMVDGQLFVESLLSFYKGNRSLIFCLSLALLHIWKHWIPFAMYLTSENGKMTWTTTYKST
jgi:hypothetical protein